MGRGARIRKGFTLIELMLVVAIIGLLAAIALPKFSNMMVKAKEASVLGHLGALRSALSIYYADNEGMFPLTVGPYAAHNRTFPALTGKYIEKIPKISIPTASEHAEGNGFNLIGFIDWSFAGGDYPWLYNPRDNIYVNCSHTDSRGEIWWSKF